MVKRVILGEKINIQKLNPNITDQKVQVHEV
jgi:hypothetical protein